MTDDPRPSAALRQRSRLDSPWVTLGLLAVIAVLIGGFAGFASLTAGPGASPSASAASTAPATSPTATPVATFTRPTPSPAPTFLSYVVQSGDSLNSIATTFHTTARSIAWWNRGTYPSLDPESEGYQPNRIEVGWILAIMPGVVVDDTNPPTPSPAPATPVPTSSPRPSPSPSPSATGTTAVPATVVSHGTRGSGRIALTFDMGGRLDPAVDIVQWLIDHDVHATLFPTGKTGSTTTQGKAALQLAATRPDLFDLGNHSWDHPDFRTLTAAQMRDQLEKTEAAIVPIAGQTTRPWFRPPFGGWNDAVRAGVGAAGWRYLVMWDVDTIDWKPESDDGPTTQGIVDKVTSKAQGGSIVLMHLGGWNTLDALPGILSALQAQGLQPVTLGEMLGQ